MNDPETDGIVMIGEIGGGMASRPHRRASKASGGDHDEVIVIDQIKEMSELIPNAQLAVMEAAACGIPVVCSDAERAIERLDSRDIDWFRIFLDLDVPGASDDDDNEMIGEEDEENNYYSLGGDNKDTLEEDAS